MNIASQAKMPLVIQPVNKTFTISLDKIVALKMELYIHNL